jgi:hypothetical protein
MPNLNFAELIRIILTSSRRGSNIPDTQNDEKLRCVDAGYQIFS